MRSFGLRKKLPIYDLQCSFKLLAYSYKKCIFLTVMKVIIYAMPYGMEGKSISNYEIDKQTKVNIQGKPLIQNQCNLPFFTSNFLLCVR